MNHALALGLVAALTLAACHEDETGLPGPVVMSADALGHYCQMALAEHPGPKAQVHLDGVAEPLFFSQVRDAIAYQRMPEQSHRIAAIYVNDMGNAPSWDAPGTDSWISATAAFFVVGSNRMGGMSAPELVPFSDRAAAEAFLAAHGGQVLWLTEIADRDVLAPVAVGNGGEAGDEDDFEERLRLLSQERQG